MDLKSFHKFPIEKARGWSGISPIRDSKNKLVPGKDFWIPSDFSTYDAPFFIIDNPELRTKFLKIGIVGYPLGHEKIINKGLKNSNYPVPFTVSPYDLIYAARMGLISDPDGSFTKSVYDWGKRTIPDFEKKNLVFQKLRDRHFILSSGLNYGGNFVIYRDRIREFANNRKKDHSLLIVDTKTEEDDLLDFIRKNRLGERVAKAFGWIGDDGQLYVWTPIHEIKYRPSGLPLEIDLFYPSDAIIVRNVASIDVDHVPVELVRRESINEINWNRLKSQKPKKNKKKGKKSQNAGGSKNE